jgi:hypothetical protein
MAATAANAQHLTADWVHVAEYRGNLVGSWRLASGLHRSYDAFLCQLCSMEERCARLYWPTRLHVGNCLFSYDLSRYCRKSDCQLSEILEFLKFAVRTELGSPGGIINFAIVGVIGLLAAGSAVADLLRFISQVLDRVMHFCEKVLEFWSDLRGGSFEASPKPDPYELGQDGRQVKLVFTVGVFFIACMLALGGARYSANSDPSKEKGDMGRQMNPDLFAGSVLLQK